MGVFRDALYLIACKGIHSVEPIRNLPIEELEIVETPVSDFSPLRGMLLPRVPRTTGLP
jgi:hypothetical protein